MFGTDCNENNDQLDKLSQWKDDLSSDLANILTEHKLIGERAQTLLVDSDDEDGESQRGTASDPVGTTKGKASPIRYVIITDASIKSYKALFKWIDTRRIEFAKLKSLRQTFSTHPFSSPKSMYALAHKLEIKDLQQTALANFSGQLTAQNALQELFSGHAAVYPELSAAAIQAVISNAEPIKAAGGPEYIKQVLQSEEVDLEYASATVAELFGKM